jgi:hypothetical protein
MKDNSCAWEPVLLVDTSDKRVGIGTGLPEQTLDVYGTAKVNAPENSGTAFQVVQDPAVTADPAVVLNVDTTSSTQHPDGLVTVTDLTVNGTLRATIVPQPQTETITGITLGGITGTTAPTLTYVKIGQLVCLQIPEINGTNVSSPLESATLTGDFSAIAPIGGSVTLPGSQSEFSLPSITWVTITSRVITYQMTGFYKMPAQTFTFLSAS